MDDLIRELKGLRETGSDFELNIAGSSHQKKDVSELADRLKNELNIKRVGIILES